MCTGPTATIATLAHRFAYQLPNFCLTEANVVPKGDMQTLKRTSASRIFQLRTTRFTSDTRMPGMPKVAWIRTMQRSTLNFW